MDILTACRRGKTDVVVGLLRSGVDPKGIGRCGYTPIIRAIEGRHIGIVHLLLDHGVDPNVHDYRIPLMRAIGNGDDRTVRLLLCYGANPNVRGESGWTPLMYASSLGSATILALLLEAGADPRMVNNGKTASQVAITVEGRNLINDRAMKVYANRGEERSYLSLLFSS